MQAISLQKSFGFRICLNEKLSFLIWQANIFSIIFAFMIRHIGKKTESIPKAVKQLMLDAWNKQLWIYDRLDDKWYTPEEFKTEWTVLVTAYNLDRFVARSPELGIAESLESLRRALERAEEFHKKLQAYYEVGLKRKKWRRGMVNGEVAQLVWLAIAINRIWMSDFFLYLSNKELTNTTNICFMKTSNAI